MKTTLIAIENDADHVQAKALVGKLMRSRRSDDRVRLVAQARLIEAYERSRWPRSAPTLPDLLNYLMDQHDLSRSDLVPMLGTASRVSEVMNGKREFCVTQCCRADQECCARICLVDERRDLGCGERAHLHLVLGLTPIVRPKSCWQVNETRPIA